MTTIDRTADGWQGERPIASQALRRFRVLDLTRARAGPTCARQFADWGADVIKVELPPDADGADDFSARDNSDFQHLHRNKRSLTLNLKVPGAKEIFNKLVESVDVVVENYRPDVKHRLGVDYETLKKINPRLVYTSISGFGQDGPYSKRPGVDQIAQGMGGLMSITGEPGRGPMRVGIPIADLTTGMFAAIGTLTALLEREVSGEGQWVQTSLLQSQIFMLDLQAVRWLVGHEVPGQVGNDHPTGVPTGVFKTSDGHINIAPTPNMWGRFCKALGREDMIENPEFVDRAARQRNRRLIHEMIDAETVQHSSDHWIALMNEAGVPCGPIYAIDQTFADPQVQHLGIAETVESPTLGPQTLVGQPVALSRTPSRLTTATPDAGANTDQILTALGYSEAEIAALHRSGAV